MDSLIGQKRKGSSISYTHAIEISTYYCCYYYYYFRNTFSCTGCLILSVFSYRCIVFSCCIATCLTPCISVYIHQIRTILNVYVGRKTIVQIMGYISKKKDSNNISIYAIIFHHSYCCKSFDHSML